MTEKKRGGTVKNPADTKYSAWVWIKGYTALVLLSPVWCFLWFMANVVRKLPPSITAKLLRWHVRQTEARQPDIRIPGDLSIPAYMLRWWKIMRNAYFNTYLHNVLRSDEDAALHDHPWWNFSIVLEGGYFEHTIAAGGVHTKKWFGPGQMQFRWHGAGAHRLELQRCSVADLPISEYVKMQARNPDIVDIVTFNQKTIERPAVTIFITGPVLRRWGFHHTSGWVDAYDWDDFCQDQGIGGMKMSGYAAQVAKTTKTED
jgi:hypothetical protein